VVGAALVVSVAPASAQNVSFGYQYQHLSRGGLSFPGGLNVDVGVPLARGVAIVGQFDWSRKSESEGVVGNGVHATFDVSTFGGGVRWTARTPSVAPFVDVLFGGTKFSGRYVADSQVASGSETDAMFQVGGGVAVPLTSMVSALGQFDDRRIFTTDKAMNSIRFVAGIRVAFGH